jgi:glycerol-3-phosphate cytidylyltransferase
MPFNDIPYIIGYNINIMKIGITFSAFDHLHAGHIKMLEHAKRQYDYLICALQTDPTVKIPKKTNRIQSIFKRYIQLKFRFLSLVIQLSVNKLLENNIVKRK